jgi:hypothetical protein
MFRLISICLSSLALIAFVGCKPSGGSNNQSSQNTTHAPVNTERDGHDHDHAEGDDHDHAADDDSHGKAKPLGSINVGGFTVNATQFGDVVPGKEASIDLELTALPQGVQPADVAVRVLVGTESGVESVKSKAEREGANHFHGHAEPPSPLPNGSKWWVEIEAAGTQLRGSFDLK